MNESDHIVYVAHRPCGCVQGFAASEISEKESRKSASKSVAMWVRDGWRITSHVNPDPKDMPDEWDCEEHRKP